MRLNELTIKRAHQGLVKKEFSAVELTEAVLNQIKKRDKDIGAYLTLDEESALDQARRIDKKIANQEKIGLLAGLPLAIKDIILVEGVKCTAGSKILENYIAPYSATVVKRLKKAGAVVVGKTNLDEFGMGTSGENSAFKPTKNPHDLERVPGGSSSGSAAALASNQCLGALGSDTGGSIRLPASFCGVVGFKPSYGRVSRYGLIAFASSLDVIGPIAKTAEDVEIIFDVIKGHDEMDSTSLTDDIMIRENYSPTNQENSSLQDFKGLKIGLPKEYFIEGIDPEVKKTVKESIFQFEKMGAKVIEISLPHSEYALPCYYIIQPAEASSNLARYDGIKYGLSKQGQDLLEGYFGTRQKGFGDEVRRRIMIGTFTLSTGYYDAYYLKAQKVRTLIRDDFSRAFEKVDVIMGPVSPTPAFRLGEKINDPLAMYLSDIYTVSVNLAGLPAVSIPCRRIGSSAGEANSLPIGLQIIGRQFEDEKVIQIAKIYERNSS
jgi:aspartyl-tRNA(Asn)/glutamyl-tRNA(Gln) amidotransferase subunit A